MGTQNTEKTKKKKKSKESKAASKINGDVDQLPLQSDVGAAVQCSDKPDAQQPLAKMKTGKKRKERDNTAK